MDNPEEGLQLETVPGRELWKPSEIYQGNGSGSGKLQRAGAPGRWRRSVQGRGSGPRKPGGPGSAEKAAEISEDPAGGPGRHPGGGKAAEAGNPGKIAEYKTQ